MLYNCGKGDEADVCIDETDVSLDNDDGADVV